MARGGIPSAFNSYEDGALNQNRTPVVFDVLGPDWTTSVLPDGVRLVLHCNPSSLRVNRQRQVERTQTLGGFVEQHWGDSTVDVSADGTTGGFVRAYTGMSNTTAFYDGGGSRRETIAYDKFLDLLALFHSNGAIYDAAGNVALQGCIRMTFDEGVYLGWFRQFTVGENADRPFLFNISFSFTVQREETTLRTVAASATFPRSTTPSGG
jgi:hypothetical protein